MSRHNKTKKQLRKLPTFEMVLGLVGAATAFIALFIAWQANRIAGQANTLAERQTTPQLEILWIKQSWTDRITGNATQVGCDNMIRLYNPGAAPATITSHIAEMNYRGYKFQMGSIKTFAGVRHDLIPNAVNLADSYILTPEDEAKERDSEAPQWKFFGMFDPLSLPIQLDSYSARDVVYRVVLTLGALLDSKDYTAGDPNSSNYEPTLLDHYAPINLSISFVLANGDLVTTPTVVCLYLQKQ